MNRNENEENNAPLITACIILFILIAVFCGCKSSVQYVPVENKVIEREVVRDTVVMHRLDIIRDTIVVSNDTVSYLENKYAYSWAMWSMGRLHHSLNIKDIDIPVYIKYVDRTREVYVDKPIEVEIVKYKDKPYTWYEKLLMAMGVFSFAYLGFSIFKRFR